VFRAYDPEQEKLVAVKWFQLDLPPERTLRLVAEFEQLIATDLTHPAIAAPRATGIVNAAAYLAQEFVTADSVDIVMREQGAASPAEAVRMVTHLAGALDAAADRQIVHGALHPRDVLVSADEVRLTGLGIAHALERAGAAVPIRRPYTAPERIAGTTWDRRADVFSLAVLVHEWLWAKRITGLGRQAADALTPLPGADLAALRQLFMRALADTVGDRFNTALEFAAELTHALAASSRPVFQGSRRRPLLTPRLPLDGSEDPVTPAEIVIEPGAAEGNPSAPLNLVQRSKQGPGGSSDLALLTPEVRDNPDPVTAPVAADQPPHGAESESASRFTESESPIGHDDRGRFPGDHAPFGHLDGAFDPTRSAVWPLGLALMLGVSFGFAAGYEVASWQRRPEAGPEPVARLAPEAQASSGSPVREFTESAVRGSPAAATSGTPGTDVSLAPNAANATRPAGSARTTVPPPAVAGRLLVRSTPAGARVVLDGRDVGETPLTLRNIPRGAHTVRIARDGYVADERRVVVSAANPAPSLTVALARARRAGEATSIPTGPAQSMAALTVESRPAGASVYLDGKLIGRTPLQVREVAVGDRDLRLELEGYRRWSSTIHVAPGERRRVAASLDR
jgi:serine/threonine protein kinase